MKKMRLESLDSQGIKKVLFKKWGLLRKTPLKKRHLFEKLFYNEPLRRLYLTGTVRIPLLIQSSKLFNENKYTSNILLCNITFS